MSLGLESDPTEARANGVAVNTGTVGATTGLITAADDPAELSDVLTVVDAAASEPAADARPE